MQTLIKKIEVLEIKAENGTITMNEEVLLLRLTELALQYLTQ